MADLVEKKYYAHTKEGHLAEEWQVLDEHLKNTTELARSFAKEFRSGDRTYLMELWYNILNTKNILIA